MPTCPPAEHHFGLARQLAIHQRPAGHLRHAHPQLQELDLHPQLVARHHHPAELRLVHPQIVRHLALALQHLVQQNPRRLRHRLQLQHARKDRHARKMPLEARLVRRHVLEAHDPVLVVALHDAVHQDERMPVRQDARMSFES
jgi:hypothetical protein